MKTITTPNPNLRDIELTIGICGQRLSGKDYIADLISKEAGFKKRSLAHPIKQEYCKFMGVPIETLYTQGERKELHRLSLITLGAIRRAQHIDWWCEALHNKSQNEIVIISDMRFKNEVEYFQNNSSKFLLFEVTADDSSLKSRGWKESFADSTSTETERYEFQPSISETIQNNNKSDTTNIVKELLLKYDLYNYKTITKLCS
tara:strand:+ start:48 stop:656 length:609 start_codon:yes stop_codon:yes gene_type:complete